MVPGWDAAVRSMQVGERAVVRVVDSEKLGYGSVGVPPLILPGQQLEFDITLLDCQPPTLNIDFDSIATLDNTPVRVPFWLELFV
jgi:FKBP-type peptidyl-prolyl cis-trans isomerase